MVTRSYADAFEYDPSSRINRLMCSIADDYTWFDAWPGLKELQPAARPLRLEFGDGTPFGDDERRTLMEVFDAHGLGVTWNHVGDLVMVCNRRWAHGRPAYTLIPGEKRELGVILGRRFTRVGQHPTAWFSAAPHAYH